MEERKFAESVAELLRARFPDAKAIQNYAGNWSVRANGKIASIEGRGFMLTHSVEQVANLVWHEAS